MLRLNVLHGGPWSGFAGDGQQIERRMDLIAEELAALRPDVIAPQEEAVSPHVSQSNPSVFAAMTKSLR